MKKILLTIALVVLAILLSVITGCKKVGPVQTRTGIPAGVTVTCRWLDHQGTCIGAGHAYVCVYDHEANHIECAPSGALPPEVTPERPLP